MAFPLVIWDRAKTLLTGGFYPDEVPAILAVEFENYLNEFQIEDLPLLARSANRQLEIIKSRNERHVNGEQRADTRQQGASVAPEKSKQSNDDSTEKPRTFG
jgi:hypothetical protein